MTTKERRRYRIVVLVSAAVATMMAALCVTDLVASYPYQPFFGHTFFSVTYLICSGITFYLCFDTWNDLDLGQVSRVSRGYSASDGTTRPYSTVTRPSVSADQPAKHVTAP